MIDSRVSYDRAQELAAEPTAANGHIREIPAFDNEQRRFELGQWLDVKDTID
jgi:hypothetical protein